MTTRDARRGRLIFFFAAFVAADAAAVMVACSSSSPDDTAPDSSAETSPPGDGGKDGPITKPDSGAETGSSCVSPANVNGKCDIVAQDCPANQECVVANGKTTECRPVETSEQLGVGHACCQGNGDGNPCLPGLTCVGGDGCTDGGPKTGRCAPACCEGDDGHCGKSDPEGIAGACDLTLSSGGTDLFRVCTYSARCKPFKVEPCTGNDICILSDKIGTASCVSPFMLPAKTNRQPCSFANECADGLVCVGGGDAGACRYACLLPGSTHPFDAGVEMGGAGAGGCPTGESCGQGKFTNLPDWYHLCQLPDGG